MAAGFDLQYKDLCIKRVGKKLFYRYFWLY